MAAPFENHALPEQGFFGSLFGRVHREALLIEIENALADAADWAAVPRDAIAAIERKYQGTLKENARNEAIMLIARAANSLSGQHAAPADATRCAAIVALRILREVGIHHCA